MKSGVISQPNYVPWLGYFQLITSVDVFVYLDDVQFTYRDWRNRNLIAVGDVPTWLTVPVLKEGSSRKLIRDVLVDNSTNWGSRHLSIITNAYKNCDYFNDTCCLLAPYLGKRHKWLVDVTIGLTEAVLDYLCENVKTYRASELQVSGTAGEHLVQICKKLNIDKYISGPAASAYIQNSTFQEAQIELVYYTYKQTTYPRNELKEYSNLSILDLLMYHGKNSKYYLKGIADA